MEASKAHPQLTVPLHLRNVPTGLMKKLGYGAEYEYPHNTAEGYVPGVRYLPEEVEGVQFYEPSEHGAEQEIAKRMKQRGGMRKKEKWHRTASAVRASLRPPSHIHAAFGFVICIAHLPVDMPRFPKCSYLSCTKSPYCVAFTNYFVIT